MTSPDTPTPRWRDSFQVRAGVLLIGALATTFALFRWVVTDPDLTLRYLQALVWPVVILVGLSLFRRPLERKLSDLLQMDVLGTSARFATSRTEDFARDVAPDLDALLGVGEESSSSTAAENVLSADPVPIQEAGADGDLDSAGRDEIEKPVHDGSPVPAGAAEGEHENGDSDSPPSAEAAPKPKATRTASSRVIADDEAIEQLLLLQAELLGMGPSERTKFERLVSTDPGGAARRVFEFLLNDTRSAKDMPGRSRARAKTDFASVERIVQKSAEWGYDLARAGHPKRTPDIERDDTGWRISTEVPPAETPVETPSLAVRLRKAQRLEEEIKSLEKRHRYGPLSIMSMPGDAEAERLKDFKKRLAVLDPTSPYAD
ncbi:hypothetical protein [Solicola sp. PLA-1-18]|uniref:hypothetical protein n=1 Tax=Solicola sp. PLA-1-18 TaxID=3380532 RepID=UPI003B7FFD25